MSNRENPGFGSVLLLNEDSLVALGYKLTEDEDIHEVCQEWEDKPEDCPYIRHITRVFGFTPLLMYVDENFSGDLVMNSWYLVFETADKFEGSSPCSSWLALADKAEIEETAWSVFG